MNYLTPENPNAADNAKIIADTLRAALRRGAGEDAMKGALSVILHDALGDESESFSHFLGLEALSGMPGRSRRGYALTAVYTVATPAGLWASFPKAGASVKVPDEIASVLTGEIGE